MGGFFKLSSTQEEDEAPQRFDEYAEEKLPTNDTKRAVNAGFQDIGQMVAGAIQYGGRKLDMPVVEEFGRGQAKLSKALTHSIESGMSEEGRAAVQAPLIASKEGEQTMWDDPTRSIGLKSMRMVPMMLASAIPGTILARVGLGIGGAAVGTGAVGAALGTGDVVNAISDEIDNISHEDLMKGSKVYRTEIEAGTPEADARETIKNIAQDESVPLTALINFATNAFGLEAMLAKAMGGHAVRKGIARGVAEGIGTGVPTEAIEGGTTAYMQEQAGETYGGDPFSWFDVAKQAMEEGFMGGVFGGAAGAATNVRRPKFGSKAGGAKAQPTTPVEIAQAATPDASQQAALAAQAGKPVPKKPPPQTAPEAGTPPPGPPTVQAPGTEIPPPGAKIERTRRNYKKPTTPQEGAPVQGTLPAGPDPTQAAAVQASKPLVRKRAQAELAAAQASQPPAGAPPVSAIPQQIPPPTAGAPPESPPQVTPPIQNLEPQVPATVAPTPPMVLGKVAPTGRVLPDLQAERAKQEEFERQAAKPDEVAGRGRRYQQTEASVNDPKAHQAWRRQMFREATKGEKPSRIALEATKIRAKRGEDLTEGLKQRLRELHTEWVAEQASKPVQEQPAEQTAPKGQRGKIALPGGLVVKNAKQFVLEAARAAREEAGDAKSRVEAFGEILRSAPNRDDISQELRSHPFVRQAADFKDKVDKGVATKEDIAAFEKAEGEFVAPSQEELDAETRDIEAGISNKGGTGAVEVSAELPTNEEASTLKEEDAVETKASKSAVVEEGTFGAASDVRRPQISEEEKARLVALASSKQRAEAAPKPSPKVQETAGSVREPVAAKPELPKKVKKAEAPKAKKLKEKAAKTKQEILDRIGWSILDMRQAAKKARAEGDADTAAGLDRDATAVAKRLHDEFGVEEYNRIIKTVKAALENSPQPILKREGTSVDELSQLLSKNTLSRGAKTGRVFGLDDRNKHTKDWAYTLETTTVADALDKVDYSDLAYAYTDAAMERGSPFARGMSMISEGVLRRVIPRLMGRAGNVPVHIIKDSDWSKLYPNTQFAAGFYLPGAHYIVMRESVAKSNPAEYARVLIHEAAHASFYWAIERDQVGKKQLRSILDEVQKLIPQDMADALGISYSHTNEHELVSEIFANPRVQRIMAETPISDELAAELKLGENVPHTLWGAFVDFVRKLLGLDANQHTALEAVLHTVHNVAGVYSGSPKSEWAVEDDPFQIDFEMTIGKKEDAQAELQPILMSAVKQGLDDRVPRSRTRGWILNLTTLHQMTQMADRYFPKGMAVKISDIVEKTRLRRADLIGAAQDRVVTRLHQLSKSNPEEFAKMEAIADRATSANIHPDVPLSDARNKHVKKTPRWRFARLEHADLHKRWLALPDDMKRAWHDARTYLVDQQNTMAELNLGNMVEHILGRKDEQLARRIFNGTMTEADKEVFRTNAAMRAIGKAQELKKIKGVYFPKMRHGDYVVQARYKLPTWVKYRSKVKDDEARYVFEDKKIFNDFIDDMRKRGLTVTSVNNYSVDDNTGARTYTDIDGYGAVILDPKSKLPKEFRFSRGDTDTHEVWEVAVQDKLVEMHESERAALESERELRADPNYETAGVQKRKELSASTSMATSRQIKRALKAMEQSGGWGKMSDAQKNATKQAFLELSLSYVGSTAPQNRARPRRNVIGASKDLVRNVAEYSAASSGSIANLENLPELEKAFDDLDQYSKHNEKQTAAITLPRSQLLEKMRENAYSDDGTAPTKRNKLINGLLTLSFMDKLVSPAYHLINMLQPWMVSAPVLGGRYGFAKSTYELGRAYNHMGFGSALASGVKDTKRAMTDLMEGTTDYIGDIRKRLAKQSDGKELADMLDYLHERGLIDKDAGLEVAELINSGSKGEHLLHRVDHVVRQFGTAVEVVNRVTTAIAAYRMERSRGASEADARVIAQEMVANTQGNYSMSNAPKIFKHPLGRTVLQFKKFAQLQYFLLSKLAYNAFKGATPAERAEAAKGLAALLVAHMAMAGATGLPTEPIKIPWLLLSLFLPMPKWEEIEAGATDYAEQFLGENLGDAVAHGLPRLVGIDLNSRVGLNSLIFFGEPRNAKENDVKSWLFDTILGAPFGLGTERIKGVRHALNGEFDKAAEELMPFKFLADAVKAYNNASEGRPNNRGEIVEDPWGLGEAFVQTLGFKPAGRARAQEKRSQFFTQSGNRKAERQELLDQFVSGEDRAAARQKILKWNAKQPKDARITMESLSRLLKRKASDKKKGYIKKGTYGGKLNKDLLNKYIGDET